MLNNPIEQREHVTFLLQQNYCLFFLVFILFMTCQDPTSFAQTGPVVVVEDLHLRKVPPKYQIIDNLRAPSLQKITFRRRQRGSKLSRPVSRTTFFGEVLRLFRFRFLGLPIVVCDRLTEKQDLLLPMPARFSTESYTH